MVCDDDTMVREITTIVLQDRGYQVNTLDNCLKLLDHVKSFGPHLILMDLMIPPLGGEQAIGLLRKEEVTKKIPVLVFSANAELEAIAKKLDVQGFIKKPFDLNIFEQIIEAQFAKLGV